MPEIIEFNNGKNLENKRDLSNIETKSIFLS